jgi:hypothetical protein
MHVSKKPNIGQPVTDATLLQSTSDESWHVTIHKLTRPYLTTPKGFDYMTKG